MDTLFNEKAASPPGKHCARPINRMGDSPHPVSNQRTGSQVPARPLNQPRMFEPGTSSFRGGRFAHCATWTPLPFPQIFDETVKGCGMDTLFNEETASPPGKHCARTINRMGEYSPHAVSIQRKAIPSATV